MLKYQKDEFQNVLCTSGTEIWFKYNVTKKRLNILYADSYADSRVTFPQNMAPTMVVHMLMGLVALDLRVFFLETVENFII
jgi:hypothetical protein